SSSSWPAKNTSAASIIANSIAKNNGATSANSTAVDPRRLRRNRRNTFLTETVAAAGDDIENPQTAAIVRLQELPESDCGSVSSNRSRAARPANRTLTLRSERVRAEIDSRA